MYVPALYKLNVKAHPHLLDFCRSASSDSSNDKSRVNVDGDSIFVEGQLLSVPVG